jgi:acetyl esterase/lipase
MQARFPAQDGDAFTRFRQRAGWITDKIMSPPRSVIVESTAISGVAGDWIVPLNAPDDPVIVFLHGGGILFGWQSPNRRVLGYLAQFAGLRAFGVDYRLAPEHLYPAAHDDCYVVYRELVQQGKRVVLVGESSGGVLALATLLRAKTEGLSQPALCALISPVVDYGFRDEGIWQCKDAFVAPEFVVEMHKHYVGRNDTMQPDLGPVYAGLSGLAPIYVLAGERELLRSEVERLVGAARQHRVEIEVFYWPDAWHGWHVLVPQLPEATRALEMLGETIRQRVSG